MRTDKQLIRLWRDMLLVVTVPDGQTLLLFEKKLHTCMEYFWRSQRTSTAVPGPEFQYCTPQANLPEKDLSVRALLQPMPGAQEAWDH
jgi:hypothetical protein